MVRSSSNIPGLDKSNCADRNEMLMITARYCLKCFVETKRITGEIDNIFLKGLISRSSSLYLQIYGLLMQEITFVRKQENAADITKYSEGQQIDSDSGYADRAICLDAYALDLLRMVISRMTDPDLRFHLSSRIASLQILHDRMKELQKRGV